MVDCLELHALTAKGSILVGELQGPATLKVQTNK